jgi:hypothetical protein
MRVGAFRGLAAGLAALLSLAPPMMMTGRRGPPFPSGSAT